MAKRERNWKPDIYDLAADRAIAVAPAGSVTTAADLPPAEADLSDLPMLAPEPEIVVVRPKPPAPGDNATVLGLVAGALAGAALTLLVTPATGQAVRARLQAWLQHGATATAQQAQAMAQKMPNGVRAEAQRSESSTDHKEANSNA